MPVQTAPTQITPDANNIVWDSQPAQPGSASTADAGGIMWDNQTTQPSQPAQSSDEIHINPSDNLLTKAGKTAGGVMEGVGEGVFGTAAGASDLFDRVTGVQPGATNSYFHTLAGDNSTSHGLSQTTGRGIEDLAEFFLGDEALKGLSVSDRLLKASKTAKAIEESPLLNRVFQVGVRALRGGTVGAVQSTVKTGDPSQAAGAGAAGAIGNAVVPEAFDAAKAAPKAISEAVQTLRNVIQPGAIQDAFQGQIRGIINDAAQEYGVSPSSAASIRDVAQNVSNQLQSKAKAAYQALDDATGGRVQRFRDAIKNVQQKINELNGIDPDQESAYVEKLNGLQNAHDKAMEEAEAQGVPRTLLNRADADFRKSKAMLDLSKQIRASSEGLRPELQSGTNKPIPEKVNTSKLFSRVNKLYDSGRLHDALGKDRSDDLLRAVNDSHVAGQAAQSWSRLLRTGAKYAAYGALPLGGYEIARHLLGD